MVHIHRPSNNIEANGPGSVNSLDTGVQQASRIPLSELLDSAQLGVATGFDRLESTNTLAIIQDEATALTTLREAAKIGDVSMVLVAAAACAAFKV